MKKSTIIGAMVFGTVVFFAVIALGVHSSANDETKELQLLHVIVRHGARSPADTYPKDPYVNLTFYPVGWGQLTNQGKLDMYNTGKFLRERYGKFLGTHYYPKQYYTQSTDVDRTKASLQMINAGLWPPEADQKWGPLDWQPIPVHSEPLAQDQLLLVRRPCAQYHLELDRVMQTEEIQNKLKENEELFKELSEITGKTVENFDDVQDIYTTLRAEEAFNLTLPKWTKNYYPDKLLPPTIFSYVLNAYTDRLKRLKGGVLLKKLLSDWHGKVDGTIEPAERKAFLYGGHDSTIANILSTLKVWDPQVPVYGIMILLEFSRDKITNSHGLEVFLRNSTTAPPRQLTIPGCDTFCPLSKLTELTAAVIPDDWEEECKSEDPNYTPPPPGGP
ncbi:venom acid phosphatase Acph-1 [Asbolus verrucosus]|uniref:Venom acid phosphatase Acph-1 n=1 Tax=Asbolus verrucosus TaxID=1661398 RepID=A0A482V806_ASBVE|nr:venom acid phosphatase Acph-1 [Asbolus verrucosus]